MDNESLFNTALFNGDSGTPVAGVTVTLQCAITVSVDADGTKTSSINVLGVDSDSIGIRAGG